VKFNFGILKKHTVLALLFQQSLLVEAILKKQEQEYMSHLRREKRGRRKAFNRETVGQFRLSLGWVLSDNFRVGQLPASLTNSVIKYSPPSTTSRIA